MNIDCSVKASVHDVPCKEMGQLPRRKVGLLLQPLRISGQTVTYNLYRWHTAAGKPLCSAWPEVPCRFLSTLQKKIRSGPLASWRNVSFCFFFVSFVCQQKKWNRQHFSRKLQRVGGWWFSVHMVGQTIEPKRGLQCNETWAAKGFHVFTTCLKLPCIWRTIMGLVKSHTHEAAMYIRSAIYFL